RLPGENLRLPFRRFGRRVRDHRAMAAPGVRGGYGAASPWRRAAEAPRRCRAGSGRDPSAGFQEPEDSSMGIAARKEPGDVPSLPPRVTLINRLSPQRRADRTLSNAVSLHLEGNLEGAAGMLSRAIESGQRDPALYSALGQIHYEMRDYESAAAIYEQLAELVPLNRTAQFNLGVCRGNLQCWQSAVESFRKAAAADATRS